MAAMFKIPAWNFTTGGRHLGGGWLSNNQVRSAVRLDRSCKRKYLGACRIEATVGGEAASSLTLYEVLGAEAKESSADDIKRAYKDLARRYHPDANPPEDHEACTQKFLEVRNAYEVLSDPNKKAQYDFAMANPMLAQAYRNSSWSRGSPHSGDGFDPWRFQWEAQLSRFTCFGRSNRKVCSHRTWGALMREKKNHKQPADSP